MHNASPWSLMGMACGHQSSRMLYLLPTRGITNSDLEVVCQTPTRKTHCTLQQQLANGVVDQGSSLWPNLDSSPTKYVPHGVAYQGQKECHFGCPIPILWQQPSIVLYLWHWLSNSILCWWCPQGRDCRGNQQTLQIGLGATTLPLTKGHFHWMSGHTLDTGRRCKCTSTIGHGGEVPHSRNTSWKKYQSFIWHVHGN